MIGDQKWELFSGDPYETTLKASESLFALALYCAEEKSLVSSTTWPQVLRMLLLQFEVSADAGQGTMDTLQIHLQ
jgi:hypothetical protein